MCDPEDYGCPAHAAHGVLAPTNDRIVLYGSFDGPIDFGAGVVTPSSTYSGFVVALGP